MAKGAFAMGKAPFCIKKTIRYMHASVVVSFSCFLQVCGHGAWRDRLRLMVGRDEIWPGNGGEQGEDSGFNCFLI